MSDEGSVGQAAGGAEDLGDIKVKRGGGAVMGVIFVLLLLGAAGAAVWYFAIREDPAEAHETFRREVLGVAHGQYYLPFWQCALAAPEKQFPNNESLMGKVMQNAGGGDASRYAEHLKTNESCLPLLAQGVPAYQALKTHELTLPEYGAMLDELAGNLEGIQEAWSSFAEYETKAAKRSSLRDQIKSRGTAYAGYEGAVDNNDAERRAKYAGKAVTYYRYLKCVLGDTDYTSFEGQPDGADAAHYKLVAAIDEMCRSGGDDYVERLEAGCAEKLSGSADAEPDAEFDRAVKHWVKQGGDYGSAVPLIECLEEAEERNTKKLVENIAKSWYAYRKTYRQINEFSREKAGSRFTSPSGSGGESAE